MRHPDNRRLGEPAKPAGRRVPVHPHSAAVQQDRPAFPVGYGAVDRSPDRRGRGTSVTLADHAQDTVAMFFAKVSDIDAGRVRPRACAPTTPGDC
jgi:hypothetical protein